MEEQSSNSVRVSYPPHSRDELVAQLRGHVRTLALRLPLDRAVLFGSCAKGRATSHSDIDVLIVYAGPVREDACRLVRLSLPIRGVEAHVYHVADARSMADLLGKMTAGGVEPLSTGDGDVNASAAVGNYN